MGMISQGVKTSAGRLFGINRIYGADGDHETVYMTRLWFGRLRLHLFQRGDADPDCHDHPWGFWTFPLRSYVEEVLEGCVETIPHRDGHVTRRPYCERHYRVVKAFCWHYRPATHTHRVLGVFAGWWIDQEAWRDCPLYRPVGLIPTIVWRDAPSRAWGFTKERAGRWCWTPWKTYVFDGGKSAPCEEQE